MKHTYIKPQSKCIELGMEAPLLDLSRQAIQRPGGGYDRDPVNVYNSPEKYEEKIDVWNNWGAD